MSQAAPESVLRSFWQHRCSLSPGLHTADGREIRVEWPGRPNYDAGPDFLGAVLRIGRTVFAGDVEVHQSPQDWFRHHHQHDPHYNRVVLHVVGRGGPSSVPARTHSGRTIPLLSLESLVPHASSSPGSHLPHSTEDSCTDRPCRTLRRHRRTHELLRRWIDRLAEERLRRKSQLAAERLAELTAHDTSVIREGEANPHGPPGDIPIAMRVPWVCARPAVWNQVLFEMVAEALGYTRNRAPLLLLARSIPLATLLPLARTDMDCALAVLFGAAGLLPTGRRLPEKESRAYVRRLRMRWREFCSTHHPPLIHETEWLFFRLRPANFPTARIAALAYLLPALFCGGGWQRIEEIFCQWCPTDKRGIRAVRTLFAIRPDVYWQHHVHFRGMHRQHGISVGEARFREIFVNAVVPLLLLSSRLRRDKSLQGTVVLLLHQLRAGDHRLLRSMQRKLWKRRTPRISAWDEQGVLEWYHRYCEPERCAACPLGTGGGVTLVRR